MSDSRRIRIGGERRPTSDDPGELGEQWDTNASKQDRAFQDAMLLALSRQQEKLPPPDNTPRGAVPRRPFAPSQVFTASSSNPD